MPSDRESLEDRQREIFERALDTWGEQAQMDMAVEECAELQAELARYWRGRSDEEDIIEEVADVAIMVRQLSLIFGPDRVHDEAMRKIERLETRLDDAE